MYHSIEKMGVIPKDDVKLFDLASFPLSFGVSIFIFEGNCASLQIETSMKEPQKFKRISIVGILVVIVMNCVVSTLAYVSYVGTVEDIILFNLPATFMSKAVNMAYSFGLIFSIPIQIAPMVDTVYRSDGFDKYIKVFREKPRVKYYVAVVAILLTCVTCALLISEIQIFINLSGSLVGILTLAILPILFYNKAF